MGVLAVAEAEGLSADADAAPPSSLPRLLSALKSLVWHPSRSPPARLKMPPCVSWVLELYLPLRAW